jgi:hypothetical protein
MSTKTTTTNTAAFNPTGMSAYNSMQPGVVGSLQQDMSDPWTAMAGNQQVAQGNASLFQTTQGAATAGMTNATNSGINTRSPMIGQQLSQLRSATKGAQSNMYTNLLLNAQQLQQGAATAASQYTPLQTGSTSTSSTGGIGTYV